MADMKRIIDLYELKAEMLDPRISPAQRRYYREVADWLRSENFATAEESVVAMRSTPYYTGATEAHELDGINLRLKAMEEVGYDDVADIHRERREKLFSRGVSVYTTSSDWINDYNRAQEKANEYAKRKEIFGKIFSGYFNIKGNPQQVHRKEAAEKIRKGLEELRALGVTFDELASQKAYIDLTMLTPAGMQHFIDFIHRFMATGGQVPELDAGHYRNEQEALVQWVSKHRQELVAVGESETWHRANCVAVPSGDPLGYDFIALKEAGV